MVKEPRICPICHNPLRRSGTLRSGYFALYCPGHVHAQKTGYVLEHRFVAEQMLGHPIPDGYQVHHKNGDRLDNRRRNLQVVSPDEHRRIHNAIRANSDHPYWSYKGMIAKKCTQCNQGFAVHPYRTETALYCSKACRMKAYWAQKKALQNDGDK